MKTSDILKKLDAAEATELDRLRVQTYILENHPMYDKSELEEMRINAEVTKHHERWKALIWITFWSMLFGFLIVHEFAS